MRCGPGRCGKPSPRAARCSKGSGLVYRTAQIAEAVGVHPNTVRMYESLGLISSPARLPNGYRVFTEEHLCQVRLVRAAFRVELVQNGLRREALAIIAASASRDYAHATELNARRRRHLDRELAAAVEAVRIVEDLLERGPGGGEGPFVLRSAAAKRLDTTIDALRNWEMNGLLQAKRMKNGYRVYGPDDMNRLAVIRALRLANYSLAAILRLLQTLDADPRADIGKTLDSPDPDEDILSVCDELVSSLKAAQRSAEEMEELLFRLARIAPASCAGGDPAAID